MNEKMQSSELLYLQDENWLIRRLSTENIISNIVIIKKKTSISNKNLFYDDYSIFRNVMNNWG
jgi:glucose-6-phosphate 1-dehydrogenase